MSSLSRSECRTSSMQMKKYHLLTSGVSQERNTHLSPNLPSGSHWSMLELLLGGFLFVRRKMC